MGRLGHGGYDVARIEAAKKKLGWVLCELDVGDAVLFDCNTLHGSEANATETSRASPLASYNAASNGPVEAARGPNIDGAFMYITANVRAYRPLEKCPDDVFGVIPVRAHNPEVGGERAKLASREASNPSPATKFLKERAARKRSGSGRFFVWVDRTCGVQSVGHLGSFRDESTTASTTHCSVFMA